MKKWTRYVTGSVAITTLALSACSTSIIGSPIGMEQVTATSPTSATTVEPPAELAAPSPEGESSPTAPEPEEPAEVDPFTDVVDQRATTIADVRLSGVPARADGAGQVVVGVTDDAGDELRALSLTDLSTGWAVPFAAECGYSVMPGSMILAPVAAADGGVLQMGASAVDLIDRPASIIDDDPVTLSLPSDGWPCLAVTATGNGDDDVLVGSAIRGPEPILFWAGEEQLLVDDLAGVAFATLPVPGLIAGPIVTADGAWILVRDEDSLTAQRFDPTSQQLVDTVSLPGTSLAGNSASSIVALDSGFIVAVADDSGGAVVRLESGLVAWSAAFPVTIDGKDYGVPQRLAADDETVAGFSGSDDVVVLDAATGTTRGVFKGSSFSNNDGAIALHEGVIVVGPFGSANWVEAYDAVDFSLAWALASPGVDGIQDVKQIDSLGPDGLVVQAPFASDSSQGIVISLITVT